MSAHKLITVLVVGLLPAVFVFGACSPEGTYKGGGRQLDPTGNGTLQALDAGPDTQVVDTGTKDSGPDTQVQDSGSGG